MISKSLIVTSVVAIANSIMLQNSYSNTYLLKLRFTSVLTGFQNLFILELNKISRNTFINLKPFPQRCIVR